MPHAATPAMFAPNRPGQGAASQAPVPLSSIHTADGGWLARFQARNRAAIGEDPDPAALDSGLGRGCCAGASSGAARSAAPPDHGLLRL